jgi:transcriptional regulator with XRE-family HTH domain
MAFHGVPLTAGHAEMFRRRRLELALTQEDVPDVTGRTVRSIEHSDGDRFSVAKVARLAFALGFTQDEMRETGLPQVANVMRRMSDPYADEMFGTIRNEFPD